MTAATTSGRPPVRKVPWIGAALLVLIAAGQIAGLLDEAARFPVTSVSMVTLDVLGLIYSVRAARRGTNRITWSSVAVSRVLSIGSTACLINAMHLPWSGWWWTGTVTGLLTYASMASAVLAVPAQRLRGRQSAAFATEVLTVAGGGFMFVWHFVLAPIIDHGTRGHRLMLEIGFPLGDLLMLIAITAFLLRAGFLAAARPVALLVGGTAIYLVADLLFDAAGNDGIHTTGPRPATVGIVVASLLLTAAARWQAVAPAPAPAPATTGAEAVPPAWASYFPYAATAAGFTLMIVITVLDNQLTSWGGLVLGMIVMTGAVVSRQLLSLRDSRGQIVTDPLTGLVNRVGMDHALQRSLRRDEPVAVLAVHLDGFKQVNELYGYAIGDRLLVEFAHLLQAGIRDTDLAARIGGDDFTVLLHDSATPGEATAAAQRLLAAATRRPVGIGAETITVRASVGIATSRPGDRPEDLAGRATIALYHAKRAGDHSWALHDPAMTDRRAQDALLARDLEDAVPGGQLLVLYQPMVDLSTGHLKGVEALVRWRHPDRGLISPLDFIPVAEQTGAISEIGLHVLEVACRQLQQWRRLLPGDQPFYVSVNVAPRQLRGRGLVDDVLAVLSRTGTVPTDLVLEVTESAVVDEQVAIPALRELRGHGIRIAVDDFGTGYSSLHYLTRLPVDILKIDRSFVAELNGTHQGAAVAQAVVHLSQALHLRTVAEGIETTEQATELRQLGCDTGQGFLYARPLPAGEVTTMITDSIPQRA